MPSSFMSPTSTSTNQPLNDPDPPLWAQIQLVQQVTTTTSTTSTHQPIHLHPPTKFKATPKTPSTSPSTSAPSKRATDTGEEEEGELGGEIGMLKERATYVSRVKPRGGVGWAEFGGGDGVGVCLSREMGREGRGGSEVQYENERLIVRDGRETATATATTTATLVVRGRVSLDVDAGDTAVKKEND